jgi:hypothetical protein
MLAACKPRVHMYLHSKQPPDICALVSEVRKLIVPMRTVDSNQLVGAQIIRWLMDECEW